MSKMFREMDEKTFVSRIENIVYDHDLAVKFSKFSHDIIKNNQEVGKPNFLRLKEEKEAFIDKIKHIDTYDEVVKDKGLLKKMIDNNYLEFLLPYIISFKDVTDFDNVEIIGIGFFEDNTEILL